jgi:hypothetical protein
MAMKEFRNRALISIMFAFVSALLTAPAIHAQLNAALSAPEQAFRSAATAQLTVAARQSRVALASLPVSYAGGEGGFVVNGAIAGVENTNLQPGATGTDFLFVYMGGQGFAVPAGFYRVNVLGKQARFIATNGSIAATLPVRIDDTPEPTARKVKVKVTASWGKNGPEVDIEITFGEAATPARAMSIEIPARRTVVLSNLPMQGGNGSTPCPPIGAVLTRADAATVPYLRAVLPALDKQCSLQGSGLTVATVTYLSCAKDPRGAGFGPNATANLTCQ